jgi:hypothetical protein
MKLTGENRSTPGKTCPSATLSTTNPTWTDPGWNPGLRGGRPAANRLSHGTAPPSRYCTSFDVTQGQNIAEGNTVTENITSYVDTFVCSKES